MNPGIGKRSTEREPKKPHPAQVVGFIKQNTKKSITLKQEYLYLEDVKTALNIHHLEVNIRLKRWMVHQLKDACSKAQIADIIEKSMEYDRHRLQKRYRVQL